MEATPVEKLRVQFNGTVYRPEAVIRWTAKRALIRFTSGTGVTRETWFNRSETRGANHVWISRPDVPETGRGYFPRQEA